MTLPTFELAIELSIQLAEASEMTSYEKEASLVSMKFISLAITSHGFLTDSFVC
jgi:hypothetical protein